MCILNLPSVDVDVRYHNRVACILPPKENIPVSVVGAECFGARWLHDDVCLHVARRS